MMPSKLAIALAAMTLLAVTCPQINAQPRVPATAVGMVLELQGQIGRNDQMRWLWCPAGSDDEYATACVALNVALNRSTTPYKPPRMAGGALVAVDLGQLGDTTEDVARVTQLWDSMAADEPYFTFTQKVTHEKKSTKKDAAEISSVSTVVSPAPHLGEEGAYVGVGRIYRVDQFARRMLSSIDDGQYYAARNISAKTKMRDYLRSRGFDLDNAQQRLATDQLVTLSNVTSRVRVVKLGQSQGVKPSKGRGLVSITCDLADKPNDPNRNGFQSLLNENFDAFEVIATLSTGQQEFSLWDANENLLKEAAPNVATDSTVPKPFNARLQPAIGCIRCHGGSEGYQPLASQFVFDSQGFGRVLGDLSRGLKTQDQFRAYQTIRSRYGASQGEVDHLLQDGRDSLARQYDYVNLKEAHGAKAAYEATARTINKYWYQQMQAGDVDRELGIDPGHDPVAAFNNAVPASDATGLIPDGSAGILNRIRNGHEITRQEWESVYIDAQTKAMTTVAPQAMQKGT